MEVLDTFTGNETLNTEFIPKLNQTFTKVSNNINEVNTGAVKSVNGNFPNQYGNVTIQTSTGGGTANVQDATSSVKGIMKLYSYSGYYTDGTMTQYAITDALGTKIDNSQKGQANGVASLDGEGKLVLPSGIKLW